MSEQLCLFDKEPNSLFSCIYREGEVSCTQQLDSKAPPVAQTTDEATDPNVVLHAEARSPSILPHSAGRKQEYAMIAREARGLEIASNSEITRSDNLWIVPSQTSSKSYAVTIDPPQCTCPDFKKAAIKCKHIFAVQYYIERERGYAIPVVPERKRKTYRQEWHEYNLAQTNEKTKLLELLFELTRDVEDLPRKSVAGRNRLPLRDMIFCCAFKTYSLFSGRRFISDLREAQQRGYISRTPHFNTIFNYLELEEMSDWLRRMSLTSSLPIKEVEWDFAADSSGFATGRCDRWVDTKWDKSTRRYGEQTRTINTKDWMKVHIMCGVKTNIITAVEITDAHANDSPQFRPLVNTTAKNFPIQSVAADKAYSAEKNLKLVLVKGGQPYIVFKSNATTTNRRSGDVWTRMLRFYQYNQDSFMEHYHKRSNVETTFSMVKAKFGERLRSKTRTAQINEALCKILCHNLCCVIQSMYELGIEVDFGSES